MSAVNNKIERERMASRKNRGGWFAIAASLTVENGSVHKGDNAYVCSHSHRRPEMRS